MEPSAGAPDSNWSSFGLGVPAEDPEIMALLFGSATYTDEPHRDQSLEIPSMYWLEQEMARPYYHSSNDANTRFSYWSQGCASNSSTSPLASGAHDVETYLLLRDPALDQATNECPVPMNFFMEEEESNASSVLAAQENFLEESCLQMGNGGQGESEPVSPTHRKPTPKRGPAMPEFEKSSRSTSRKKTRASAVTDDVNRKSLQSKKSQKNIKNSDTEECKNTVTLTRQNSGCFSSEDDSSSVLCANDGEENSGTKAGSSSKTRAGRGSATDPQSLYARKRRERINERLKILQSLVPNGTKVDISTMLEEAVQYVKFLQLQIKLLSSDDMWMYAPIAYNGMDIGLDLKISPP